MRTFVSMFLGLIILASGCSSGSQECCSIAVHAGTGGGIVCVCGNATVSGASCTVTATANSCSIACTSGGKTTTTSGALQTTCSLDGG